MVDRLCAAVPRGVGLALSRADVLRVDTFDQAPDDMHGWRTLNPFHRFATARIPVPGTNLLARSMESVWQGLKVVDGQTDLDMLERVPVKRPPDSERGVGYDYAASCFAFGDVTLPLIDARWLIYLPAYLAVLDRVVDDAVVQRIVEARANGRAVAFYDWDANFDIADPTSSYSHSAILARYFDGALQHYVEGYDHARLRTRIDAPTLPLDRYRALLEEPTR